MCCRGGEMCMVYVKYMCCTATKAQGGIDIVYVVLESDASETEIVELVRAHALEIMRN